MRIARDAFRGCAGLAQVTLPATVAVIESGEGGADGEGAFSECSSLSEIPLPLPADLTEIGPGAFYRRCTVRPWLRSRCCPPSPRSDGASSTSARPQVSSRWRPTSPRLEGPPSTARQAQECLLYSALAGKGDGQGHRGLLGSVSALQRVVVGDDHLGGRCGGLGCGLVTQATL